MFFAQLLVLGLIAGAVFALVGIGFTLILGVGKVANFAHGAFVGVGLYMGFWAHTHLHVNPYLMLLPGTVILFLVGLLVAFLFQWRASSAGEIGELLVGLALLLLINGILEVTFGDDPHSIIGVNAGTFQIFGLSLHGTEVIAAVSALVLAVAVTVAVLRTRWGRALRAVAENADAAGLCGIRLPVARQASIVLSVVLAGVGGILVSPFTVMTPDIGTTYLISALAVVIVGGIGNSIGAVVAAFGIGVAQSISSGYLNSTWTTLVPMILILVFLFVRSSRTLA